MPTKTMSLARIGPASLFLGLWTPVVALAIVWATAASGAPILFALEHVGVDRLDRPAVAIALAPPLPYLFALVALSAGMAARRLSASYALPERARRALVLTWLATGVLLSSTAPLSLYAEHGTANEPLDEVHLALWLATWAWWSITASGIAVALALRGHAAVVLLASRSRAVGGTALGLGVLSLSMASVVVVPSAAREPIDEWVPGLGVVGTQTESIVLSLAGASNAEPGSGGSSSARGETGGSDADAGDDRYAVEECLEVLATIGKDARHVLPFTNLQIKYPGVDVSDVAASAGIEICEGRPRRSGSLGGLHFDATRKRVASQVRDTSTAQRNERDVGMFLMARPDDFRRAENVDVLDCLMEGLSTTDQSVLRALLAGNGVQELALRRGMTRAAAAKALFRAKTHARLEGPRCGIELP